MDFSLFLGFFIPPAVAAGIAAVGAVTSVGMGIFAKVSADQRAGEARKIGELEATRVRRQGARELSAIQARFGASGVNVASGTPLGVLADKAAEVEEDALLRIARGGMRAGDISTQGTFALVGGILGGIQGFATAGLHATQASTILGGPTVPTGMTVPAMPIGSQF